MAYLGSVADQKRQVPVAAPVDGEDPFRLKPRADAQDRAIGPFQRLGIEGQQERPLTQPPLGRRADPAGGAIGTEAQLASKASAMIGNSPFLVVVAPRCGRAGLSSWLGFNSLSLQVDGAR